MHFAVEGAPARTAGGRAGDHGARAPPPRACVRRSRCILPIRCSAACDVRATLADRPPELDVTATLTAAGTARAASSTPAADPVAPANGKPLKVTLRYGPPGTRAPLTKTVRLKLKRLPAPPLPHLLNVRVARDGKDLIVRWEIDGPAARRPTSSRSPTATRDSTRTTSRSSPSRGTPAGTTAPA